MTNEMNQMEKTFVSIFLVTIIIMFILLIWDTKFKHDCALNPKCKINKIIYEAALPLKPNG